MAILATETDPGLVSRALRGSYMLIEFTTCLEDILLVALQNGI